MTDAGVGNAALSEPYRLPAGEVGQQANEPAMTKQQAADAVKALIKPLYAAKTLSKDQFKAVAQSCTHTLADRERPAERSVRQVVRECLSSMGLSPIAALL